MKEQRVKSKDFWILIGSLVIYLLIYVFFYPKIYAIFDEACYLDLAYAMRKGTIYLEKAGIRNLHYPIKSDSHLVSRFPFGNSVFLSPFTLLGIRGLFLYGLIFHLLGYIIFIKVIRELEIDPKYSVLYLFYPPQVLFSRTLMSDIPGAFFFLLGFYAYQKKKYIGSGVAFGLASLIRYINIILVPGFLIFALIREKARGLKIALGVLPFILGVLFYNYLAYGGFFKTSYGMEANALFSLRDFGLNLGVHIFSLLIFYPLMLISPCFYKKRYKGEILASCIVMLLFYSFFSSGITLYRGGVIFYGNPSIRNILKVSLLSIRFFFPIVPLFLIAYSSPLKTVRKGFWTIWVGLVIISIGIHWSHNRYLNLQAKFINSLYSHTDERSIILCNWEVAELVSDVWGSRNLLFFEQEVGAQSALGRFEPLLLSGQDVWFASVIKFDKPSDESKVFAFKDSLAKRVRVELVEKIDGIDKRFELYRLR